MTRLLLATLALGLLSSAALPADKWTDEEFAAGVKKVEYVRYAISGKTMKLNFYYALDTDCADVGYSYSIMKQAEHGKAEVVPYSDYPNFVKDNPRHKCNEQKVDGFMLTYTSNKGYTGPDSIALLELTTAGLAREVTWTFNVRKFESVPTKQERNANAAPLPEVIVPKQKAR